MSEDEEPTEEDMERIEVVGSYLNLLTEMVSPLIQSAVESENAQRDMTCLSIALLTLAHTSMEPFTPEDRAGIDEAAGALFGIFREQFKTVSH